MVLHHRSAGDPVGDALFALPRTSRAAGAGSEPTRLVGLPGMARGQRRSPVAGAGHLAAARGRRISGRRTRRARGSRDADRPATGLVDLEHSVVDVAVHPVLAALERLDDRMAGGAEVLGRVLVLRRVAAANVAADLAQAQVNPGVPHLQTFLAALGFRLWITNQLEMRADLCRGQRPCLLSG